MVYQHTVQMGDIGVGDEEISQRMLAAGVNWMQAKPAFEFAAEGHGEFGLVYAKNNDTQDLIHHIIEVVDAECTAFQVTAIMLRLGFIWANGWDKYVEKMRHEHLP